MIPTSRLRLGTASGLAMPTSTELLACLDWRWKTALVLLLASPASLLLPSIQAPWAAAAALGLAALLALLSSAWQLRQMLEIDPAGLPAEDTLTSLEALLESQRGQMHDAASAVSRAVTAGAQLAGLTRSVEQQCRRLLEHEPVPAPLPAPSPISLLEDIRASLALHREATASDQAQAEAAILQRLEALACQVDALAGPSTGQATLQPELDALQALSQRWATQIDHAAHHDASLGDAARYLTETADRLREGTQSVESHAVRLQALISLSTHRQDDAAAVQAGLLAQLETMLQQTAGDAASPAAPVPAPGLRDF